MAALLHAQGIQVEGRNATDPNDRFAAVLWQEENQGRLLRPTNTKGPDITSACEPLCGGE